MVNQIRINIQNAFIYCILHQRAQAFDIRRGLLSTVQ